MVDSTWAGVTQLMDARTKTWSETILRRLRIPLAVMPPIVAPGTVVGSLYPQLAEAAGVAAARLTAVGSHDTACAFAAAPMENASEALIISSGTWSLLGRLVPEPVTTPAAMRVNLSNEGGIGNVRLLKNCMGGWLAQELRRAWRNRDGREPAWEELNRLATEAPPFAAFVNPDDSRFYNPPDMSAAIGTYCEVTGQRPPADRGALLRAVYESLALKYRAVNEQIEQVTGSKSRVIHVVGGGCRNEMLNQFTAEATGLPVLAGPEEATGAGNLMTQAVGLGVVPSWEAAVAMIRRAFPIRVYHPREALKWAEAYRRFKECTRRVA